LLYSAIFIFLTKCVYFIFIFVRIFIIHKEIFVTMYVRQLNTILNDDNTVHFNLLL